MQLRIFSKITPVNRSLILLDWIFFLGWEMLAPIMAVFITREIGATLAQAGYAVAIAWLTKAVFQIMVSVALDRRQGENDEFYALLASTIIAGFVGLGYYFFARSLTVVYGLQFVQGLRGALYSASWPAIFSRHLDGDRVSFQWSLDTATLALIVGIAGAAGGYLANQFGFRIVFLTASILSFVAAIPLARTRPLIIRQTIKIKTSPE